MSKFLNRTLIFIIILTIVVSVISIFYSQIKNKYLSNSNFVIDKKINILILGDSHSEAAFNDKIIPNSVNYAFSAEHYLFTYFKLKKIIEANPQINKVVLSFAAHNISKNIDDVIFLDTRNSRSFARYFMLLNRESIWECKSNSQNWKINYLKWKFSIPFQLKLELKLIYKVLFFKKILVKDYPFIGKFYKSKHHVFSNLNNEILNHYFTNNSISKESDLNIKYLNKIVDFVRAKKIKLYLINTPQHKKYRERIPIFFKKEYKLLSNKLVNKDTSLIKIIDLSEININDTCYGDYHHVNYYGATIVSNKIIDVVK